MGPLNPLGAWLSELVVFSLSIGRSSTIDLGTSGLSDFKRHGWVLNLKPFGKKFGTSSFTFQV